MKVLGILALRHVKNNCSINENFVNISVCILLKGRWALSELRLVSSAQHHKYKLASSYCCITKKLLLGTEALYVIIEHSNLMLQPGYPNPTFQLKVVRLSDKKTIDLMPPEFQGK